VPGPGVREIRENEWFRVMKAMVAANTLRKGVKWIDKFATENQAVLDHGGVILIEGFYRKSTHRIADLSARGKVLRERDVPE